MNLLDTSLTTLGATVKDVFPVLVLLLFQLVILRRPLPNWRRVAFGSVLVLWWAWPCS